MGIRESIEHVSFLTPPEVARRLRVNPGQVLYWIDTKELEALNTARRLTGRPRWKIGVNALIEFEQRRTSIVQPKAQQKSKRPNAVIEFY